MLSENEKRFFMLMSIIDDVVWVMSLDGNELYYTNPAFEKLYGKTVIDFYLNPDLWKEAIHHDDFHIAEESINELFISGHSQAEYRIMNSDGSATWVNDKKYLIRDIHGNKIQMGGIVRNINQSKKNELIINESRRNQRAILDNTPDMAWLKNSDNRYIAVNKAMSGICGLEPPQLIGKTDHDIWPEEIAGRFSQESISVMQSGIRKQKEEKLTLKNGKIYWFETIRTPIRDDEGKIIGVAGTSRDITAHKHAENKLIEYDRDLRALTQELSFVEEKERRRIAMELHDHVSQNLAYCKIRLGEFLKEAGQEASVQPLKDVAGILSDTIQSIRTLTFELSPPVLYELGLESAIEWLGERMVAERGMQFNMDSDNSMEGLSQEMRIILFQIVRELINNVTKHSMANKVEVIIRKENDSAVITVKDDGIGFNVSEVISRKASSYGFFSIQERLKHIGGFFNVKSSPGRGVKACITAPFSQEEAHEKQD